MTAICQESDKFFPRKVSLDFLNYSCQLENSFRSVQNFFSAQRLDFMSVFLFTDLKILNETFSFRENS